MSTERLPPRGTRGGNGAAIYGSHLERSTGARAVAIVSVALVVLTGLLFAVHRTWPAVPARSTEGAIPVVACESFWGSLVAQLGGAHVHVLSIVSDPNADPHQYEANIPDAVAVANARIVIQNGAGYDNWATQLLSASKSPTRVVLNVADLLGKKEGDNPHFWYGRGFVNATVAAMYADLVLVDRGDQSYFQQQYATLNTSLQSLWAAEYGIQSRFAGARVASTETVFQYLADSTALNLTSPYPFMQAVSEGNDPPASSVTGFVSQLSSGVASVLVYNAQTVTPLTEQMKAIAADHHLPLVAVTETIQPSGVTFEVWMAGELAALQDALDQATGMT